MKSKLTKVGYELESIHIVQAPISNIDHRSECDPMVDFHGRKVYPVIVSPMGAVTDENNYKIWLDNGFMCCVPRTVNYKKRIKITKETFASFSLSEAESLDKDIDDGEKHFVCIDIANGTMERLYKACRSLKAKFGCNIVIITGNVANPEAYTFYAKEGIDFMRACIGTGSRCVCEGTQVLMADGTTLPIEDIDAGDVVKTINGNKRVIKTFSKKVKETIVINGEIETTPEHRFLVLKKSDAEQCNSDEKIKDKAFYLEAKYINNDYLLVKG